MEGPRNYRKLVKFCTLIFICFLIAGSFSLGGGNKLRRDTDKEFDMGSKISFSSISDKKIMDIAKLGKVWGLVKYYHPEVVAGNVNWDYELFRIMPSILEDGADVNSILYDWVDSLDSKDYVENLDYEYNFSQNGIQLSPATDWCKDEEYLGVKLSNKLSSISQYHISERENAYVSFQEDSPYAYMDNEDSYPNMKFDDTGYRLLGLFRYWNIIEYYFPYKDIIGQDWDNVLLEFIPKFVEGTDYNSYLMTTAELTTRIHDSHSYVKGQRKIPIINYLGMYRAPVDFVEIDNQIVISKIIKECGLELGDIVIKIGDKDINELIDSRRNLISLSREDTNVGLDLFRTPYKYLDFTVIRSGRKLDVEVMGTEVFSNIVDTKSQEMEDGNIYYINAGLLREGEIDTIMEKWWDTKGLIIDLRNYPSTSFLYEIAEYLIPTPNEFFLASIPNPAVPGEFYYLEPHVSGKPKESKGEVYKGKVVIIVNERTASQGETTTMSLRNAPNSVVIGRTTAGTNGDVRPFKLPGNIETRISGLGIFYPDKTPTQRIGLQPDIYVEPTIEGIKAGRDEYIERAIQIIRED